ncbi:MAG TPA: M23 family metallopeptidase [Terriglobales bacterium]|nr:M23 family metallopeptidase [Terriglobales bacterium]
MRRTPRLQVLVVTGDGAGLRRFGVPRWAARAALAVAVVGVAGNVALALDYLSVRREHGALVATRDRLAAQAEAFAPIERRIAEVRAEMLTWDTLHAAIWRPLGAEQRMAGVGVGGPTTSAKTPDPLELLLAHVRAESQRLRALARVTKETGRVLAALPSKWPVRGALNSGFGPRPSPWTGAPEFHAGVDLAARPGTPVSAPAPGTVRSAGAAAGYGVAVVVDHGHGIESRYGHLQSVSVARGQRVERGQQLGLSGNTGRSTAPHLHYEVLVDGRAVDPRRLARD